jgi:predicted nuclease of predicted toxin-antitoxin system
MASDHRLAVLIDADNVSAKIAGKLFEKVAKIGEASVRRIYGDFSSSGLKPWADVLARYAITPQQQFANIAGKNASDIALVIDAMDLLHSGRFEGFCLVSSDSDFTRLACRIREQGVNVYGFGEQKTPESFRQACHSFINTENLLKAEAEKAAEPPRHLPSAAIPLLKKALSQIKDEAGWCALGPLGQQLRSIKTDFNESTYGCGKLSDLVRRTDAFDLIEVGNGGWRVRSKLQVTKAQTQKPARP